MIKFKLKYYIRPEHTEVYAVRQERIIEAEDLDEAIDKLLTDVPEAQMDAVEYEAHKGYFDIVEL